MLLGNGSVLHKTPVYLNGGAFGMSYISRERDEMLYSARTGFGALASIPAGYGMTGAVVPCITAGAMTCQYGQRVAVDGAADLAQGLSIAASGSAATVDGSASLGAVVRMDASGSALSFTGNAAMYGVAYMDALGGITFEGAAGLGGLFSISADGFMLWSGSAETHSLAHLETTESSGQMTEQTIAAAVWSALAAQFNEAGTMGQKLNGAGSAGDPWSDSRALTVAKFLGLK